MPPGDEDPTQPDPDAITIPVQAPQEPPTGSRRAAQPASTTPPAAATFTAEQVEAIRLEEQQKIQTRLAQVDTLEAQLAELHKEKTERDKAEAKRVKEAEAAQKKAAEEEMSAKELIEAKEKEWQQRFEAEQNERRKLEVIMEKERELAALQVYLAQRMTEDGEDIIDRLRPFVRGNTREEIDASFEEVKAASQGIASDVQQNMTVESAARRTVGVTAPPIGPPDMQSGPTQSFSLDDLRAMSVEEYAQHRPALLAETSRQRSGGRR